MMKNCKMFLVALLVLSGAVLVAVSGCPKSGEQAGGQGDQITPPPAAADHTESGAVKTPETTPMPENGSEAEANGEMGETVGESEAGGESEVGSESESGGETESGGESEAGGDTEGGDAETGGDESGSAEGVDGFLVYKEVNCTMCHGADRSGSTMAPALTGLNAYWDVGKLSQYLRDPEGYSAKDPRLSEQDQQYAMQMPPFEGSDEELAALAAWLLKPPPPPEE
jgi:mono/diheme cytochrome c family protein